MSSLLSINNVEVPMEGITGYDPTYSDVDSSDTVRDELAMMHRQRVRSDARKISASWKAKATIISQIKRMLKDDQFTLTFFDIDDLSYKTMTAYYGDRSCKCVSFTDFSKPQDSIWELSVVFVEY